MFCMLLFHFVKASLIYSYFYVRYVFHSVYSVLFCHSVYSLCVNVYCTAATGCQPNCS